MTDLIGDRACEEMDGETFYRVLVAALEDLRLHCDEVNSLNVYPVPDGDTGTNMVATLESAIEHISDPCASLSEVADEVSMGSLMGARGNSGVILSQLLRGFAARVDGEHACSAPKVARAMQSGVKAAYSAVMRPVEGTILTVAREAAAAAQESAGRAGDLLEVARASVEMAQEALDRTPDMLDVLKEAGVVDAGGRGLVCILQGAVSGLRGEHRARGAPQGETQPSKAVDDGPLEHPYDVVLLLESEDRVSRDCGRALKDLGDSLIIVNESGLTKVHIHTADPVAVLQSCSEWGELVDGQIQNMQRQSTNSASSRGADGSVAIIPTAAGPGLRDTFLNLGASNVVEGGPTMNPSTEDILAAVEDHASCDRVFLLPNNPNVILTCEQVGELSSCEVSVIPTRNIPQGLAALMSVRAECEQLTPDEMERRMHDAVGGVCALEVTHAVDDRSYSGLSLNRGDIIGFADGELVAVGDSPVDVLIDLLDASEDSRGHLTVFWGAMVSESVVDRLREQIDGRYGSLQIEVAFGGQDHYHFIAALR